MQLEFLGEAFSAESCQGMCDNCKLGLKVSQTDFTTESQQIVRFVNQLTEQKSNFTLKMVVEMLKGRSIKSAYNISSDLVEKWSGSFKHMSDVDLHRLVVKLLILSVLEEQFVATRGNGPNKNISAYVCLGKKASALMNNSLTVFLSAGIKNSSQPIQQAQVAKEPP